MNGIDFYGQVPDLVNGFLSRIPSEYQCSFQNCLDGGEYGRAVDNLVILLASHQISATAGEREQLRDMLEFLRRDNPEIVDTFTVRPAPETDAST